MKKRLFIDMDGTIARFYESKQCVEEMCEEGFFRNLGVYRRVVLALKKFAKKHPEVQLIVLSATPASAFAEKEKNEWLDEHLSFPNRLFTEIGVSKASYISDISKNDFLLDDYTKNLREWTTAGGIGIKVRNELNCKRGTWDGKRISAFDPSDAIVADLEDALGIT